MLVSEQYTLTFAPLYSKLSSNEFGIVLEQSSENEIQGAYQRD